jgi:1,4-dihydroxy-2-naphthoyl-CoA synthase
MTFEDISYERRDGVAYVTIDRQEKLNAVRLPTLVELREAIADANDAPEIGVIVVTGAGERAFCSGGELTMPLDPDEDRRFMREALRLAEEMRGGGKPIIARIKGWCIAAGNELNMLCDLSIASQSARFGHTGPRVGSVPTWYGIQGLLASVGEKRTREIVYRCGHHSAEQALAWGWINHVAAEDELDAAVHSCCLDILDKGPAAIKLAKSYINTLTDAMHATVYQGIESILLLHQTEEAAEGMRAFLERREPHYRRPSDES